MTDYTITLTEDELEMVSELKYLRAERKDIEAREKELRDEILQRLDGAPEAVNAAGRIVVKVKSTSRRGVDRSKLEAIYPEVFEEVLTETDVTILDIP